MLKSRAGFGLLWMFDRKVVKSLTDGISLKYFSFYIQQIANKRKSYHSWEREKESERERERERGTETETDRVSEGEKWNSYMVLIRIWDAMTMTFISEGLLCMMRFIYNSSWL